MGAKRQQQSSDSSVGNQVLLVDGGKSLANSAAKLVASTPYENGDIIMAWLIKAHHVLYTDLEKIAHEIAFRMKPQPEEQLLGLMNALLHRCYQVPPEGAVEVVSSLRTALEEVSKMCFGTGVNHGPNRTHIAPTIVDLKPAFEAELAPQTAKNFPLDVELFITRLRRWKIIFQRRVDLIPDHQNLEQLSRFLTDLRSSKVEVFAPDLNKFEEPNVDFHPTIERISVDVKVLRRHSGASRRLHLIGSDGASYYFVLETSVNFLCQRTEERSSQLCRMINYFLEKDNNCRRKRLRIDTPSFIPTGQHTRLVSDNPSTTALSDALESFTELEGGAIDNPLRCFRKVYSETLGKLKKSSKSINNSQIVAAKLEAFNHVCSNLIPDSCLSDWVSASIPNVNHLFLFRKRLAQTLGTSSLFVYAFAINARKPQNILVSRDSGSVSQLYLRPVISSKGVIECDEPVPFRLTRNLRHVITDCGVHGILSDAMSSFIAALNNNSTLLKYIFESIIRDELTVWTTARIDALTKATYGNDQPPLHLSFNVLLEERVTESLASIFQRLGLPLEYDSDASKSEQAVAAVEKVRTLVESASKESLLCLMDQSWHAWF
mmetsp:Transcript_22257/g.55069  ORF Transcript_22257/g.55069 Transcript_22257/m.55069 type:complete len:604 (-) Transcript_22257:91-1902(-)